MAHKHMLDSVLDDNTNYIGWWCKELDVWVELTELPEEKKPQQYFHPFPANIRLGEDVLKTSSRRLQDVFSVTFFCLPRRFEDVLKT